MTDDIPFTLSEPIGPTFKEIEHHPYLEFKDEYDKVMRNLEKSNTDFTAEDLNKAVDYIVLDAYGFLIYKLITKYRFFHNQTITENLFGELIIKNENKKEIWKRDDQIFLSNYLSFVDMALENSKYLDTSITR